MEIRLHALALLVHRVDLVAAAVHLDAADLPFLLDQLFFELALRLPAGLRTGIAGGESGRKDSPAAIKRACPKAALCP